jgi:hypothetical protein
MQFKSLNWPTLALMTYLHRETEEKARQPETKLGALLIYMYVYTYHISA